MRAKLFLQPSLVLLLACTVTAACGQARPCSALAASERAVASASGACQDTAPIAAPIESRPASEVRPDDDTQSSTQSGVAAERVRVPQVVGMPIAKAEARLDQFRIERIDRPSDAPLGQVVAQSPKAFEPIARGQAISLIVSTGPANSEAKVENVEATVRGASRAPAERLESPSVVERVDSKASNAPTEFKDEPAEVHNTVPLGEVNAQDQSAVTSATPGALPGSDPALTTSSPTTAPVVPEVAAAAPTIAPVAPEQALVRAPVQTRVLITFVSNAMLTLGAGIVLGLIVGVLLARRWLLNRGPVRHVVAPEPPYLAHIGAVRADAVHANAANLSAANAAAKHEAAEKNVPVAEPPPVIRFVARLDEGETTIEFAAPSEPDAGTDSDEMIERSGDVHA